MRPALAPGAFLFVLTHLQAKHLISRKPQLISGGFTLERF
jgi:hypothetical protein